ncbi:MAG: phage portal protein [Phycisphaeraceae bacterium]|nr:phage portal protein [Phycisphaeraceae bacterium]
MLGWLKHLAASPKPQRQAVRRPVVRIVKARFDAAVTNEENRRHWANADGLSANAALSPQVRRILRNRARYEVANNSYARGIVLTLANDTVGTGPSLQMLTDTPETNRRVEEAFGAWAEAVNLAEKLRTLRMARADSGEAFALLTSNPAIDHPVQLDLRLVEADQIATPAWGFGRGSDDTTDGIAFDRYGNPVEYHMLRRHPGDAAYARGMDDFVRVTAGAMVHYFRVDRPGQVRGIPDITPALPLFAQLRRYTLAVIAAAETAADFAAVLYTDAPANGEAESVEPMDIVELERRMATVLPGGWKLGQITAEQPATTYGEFKKEILNEIARCLNMPFNIAAGNSSGYNYASGRLDHQTYYKSIRVDQSHLEAMVLDRVLAAWFSEAVLIDDLLPQPLRLRSSRYPHQWMWDGQEHVDPAKEANAQATRLISYTTTLANEYAKQGKDWETELRQRARELKLMKELGLTAEQAMPAPANSEPQDEEEADDAPPRKHARKAA